MERAITKVLLEWKIKSNRKPLIVRGARQVGKSYSIEHFGHQHFRNIHVVNFEKHPDWHSIFDQNFDVSRILSELSLVLGVNINSEEDLLFFDEIQACPKAIVALRYFYENLPQLPIISAGSLMEFVLSDLSFPVGRVEMVDMYPMNFSEFLAAIGQSSLAGFIEKLPTSEFSETVHNQLMSYLKIYYIIGGLPECVFRYVHNQSFVEVMRVQDDIIATYRQDFSKYRPRVDPQCLNDVLTSVSQNIGKQIKYTELSRGFTGPTNKKAFDTLCTARVLHKVKASSPFGLPLAVNASNRRFKSLFLDIGLMVRISGFNPADTLKSKNVLGIFKGALAEQFVGQEFLTVGHQKLYYWSRESKSSQAEVDYLYAKRGNVVPVEVKSSSKGRLRSLHLLLQKYPEINQAIVLMDRPYTPNREDRIVFLPLYYAYACARSELLTFRSIKVQ